jgi:hypothetical protein
LCSENRLQSDSCQIEKECIARDETLERHLAVV